MNESNRSMAHSSPDMTPVEALFGPLPVADQAMHIQLLHQLPQQGQTLELWQVRIGQPAWVQLTLCLVRPEGLSAVPVLLSPDGCWPHVLSNEAIHACVQQRVALAWFNRIELAHDGPRALRAGPVHEHWPDVAWSATSVWAWGLCRSAQALRQVMGKELGALGVIGHSRGGKAALLAGAVDTGFQAVIAHNSGTGGAASLHAEDDGAETLAQLAARFPHWLAPQATLEKTQQALVACNAPYHWLQRIAPRGLCILQAHDDLWANPAGTRQMVELLRPAWQERPEQLQWHERAGGHAMTTQDWQRAARFLCQMASVHCTHTQFSPNADRA